MALTPMEQFLEFVANHWMLWTALVVVVALLVAGEVQRRVTGVDQVGPNQAIQVLDDEGLMLDVREDKEYQAGHIHNAKHIPLSELPRRIDEIKAYRDRPVVAYCRSGSRSNKAGSLLRKQGFESVYNLAGGIMAWENANLPTTKK